MLRNTIQDLRYAMRQIRRAPGFAFTVILTLSLSVGVATAVFCVIDAVILRPLPFAHPERIVDIVSHSQSGYEQPASWPSYSDERAQAHDFAALAGYMDYSKVTVDTPSSGPTLLDSVRSTGNFFQVFGVKPLLGRTYLPGEEQEGKNDVAVLSYDLWQNYFGGDRDLPGKTTRLDGRTFTIIGVMPAGFRFPLNERDAVYYPLHRDQPWMVGRGNHWLRTVGRVKEGAGIAEAQADLRRIFADLGRAYPGDAGRTVHLQMLSQAVNEKSRGPLWTLLAAVLAVLAIGCVNVAGLLIARGVQREREMAVRTAIGAGRLRLVRQLLVEGVLLGLLGAGGGILVGGTILDLMRSFLVKALERGAEIHFNWAVLTAAISAAIMASLAASLFPALLISGIDPNRSLKSGGNAGAGRAQHKLRAGLIVTQVALTLVLLVVAGQLIGVVTRYRHANLGFNPARILATDINLSPARYEGRDPIADFYTPLLERVAQIPGVRAVGVINILPIESYGSNSDIHIAGQPPYPPNREMLAENRAVSTGYFNVFGIPLRRGRMLSPALDRPENAAPTVVVNEAFVRKFVPANLDPTMQRTDDADKEENWTRIVGVVGNVRQDIYEAPLAERDFLIDELPAKELPSIDSMSFVLRFDGSADAIIPALRSAIHNIDPTIPFVAPRTMDEIVSETLVFERMESWLFGIFAGLALLLAMVGLYGLVSHEVEQGTRDIGIRMALGASRSGILAMVLRRVGWMLGAGAVAGLVLAVAARKLIGILIYFDLQKESGEVFLLAVLLVATGLLVALIPARRAASVEPMRALRAE
jgi:predicted permease